MACIVLCHGARVLCSARLCDEVHFTGVQLWTGDSRVVELLVAEEREGRGGRIKMN